MRDIAIIFILVFTIGNTNFGSSLSNNNNIIKYDKIEICESKIINNNIVKNIFTIKIFNADTNRIKNIFIQPVRIKIVKEKSIYDDNEYLNYLFESQNSFIKLFKNDEGFYIAEAQIKNNCVKLYKGLFIGMQKKMFLKLLSIKKSVCDTVIVTNEDQTLDIKFVFEENILKELIIESSD